MSKFFAGINSMMGNPRQFLSNKIMTKAEKEPFLKGVDDIKIVNDADEFLFGKRYFISENGKMGLIFINLSINTGNENVNAKLVNTIENKLKGISKKFNVQTSLTGLPVVERDELVTMTQDMMMTTIFSLVLILLIFYMGFKMPRYSI